MSKYLFVPAPNIKDERDRILILSKEIDFRNQNIDIETLKMTCFVKIINLKSEIEYMVIYDDNSYSYHGAVWIVNLSPKNIIIPGSGTILKPNGLLTAFGFGKYIYENNLKQANIKIPWIKKKKKNK